MRWRYMKKKINVIKLFVIMYTSILLENNDDIEEKNETSEEVFSSDILMCVSM